jgi:hypothetical protein
MVTRANKVTFPNTPKALSFRKPVKLVRVYLGPHPKPASRALGWERAHE